MVANDRPEDRYNRDPNRKVILHSNRGQYPEKNKPPPLPPPDRELRAKASLHRKTTKSSHP